LSATKLLQLRFCWALVLLASLCGCRLVDREPQARGPLAGAAAPSDSVTLEVFFARVPAARGDLIDQLWQHVDEQQLEPELRRRLGENGFRAGVSGAQPPAALVQLLKLAPAAAQPAEPHQVPATCLEGDPEVTLRVLHARGGRRSELVASRTYERWPLLAWKQGHLQGRLLEQAEGRLALQADPLSDGRTRLELLPEVHYGRQQPHWVGGDGVLRFEPGRPRMAFDDLALAALLSPGQMLLVTSAADRPGSLGHYFLTDDSGGKLTRKLLVVRLAHGSAAQAFSAGEPTLDLTVTAGP
jgi:hypothetical protein